MVLAMRSAEEEAQRKTHADEGTEGKRLSEEEAAVKIVATLTLDEFPIRELFPDDMFRMQAADAIRRGKILRDGFGRFGNQYRGILDREEGKVQPPDQWYNKNLCWPDSECDVGYDGAGIPGFVIMDSNPYSSGAA